MIAEPAEPFPAPAPLLRGDAAPVLSRLPVPLQTLADLLCGAFTRPDVRKTVGAATPAYLAVLRALLDHIGAKHNRVYPSQKRLMDITGLCHSTIERAVAFFQKAGAIVVIPGAVRRSPDAHPVNIYDLSPLFAFLSAPLQPVLVASAPTNPASASFSLPAFFCAAPVQNCGAENSPQASGSEGSVVVSDSYTNKNKQQTPSQPLSCGAEDAPHVRSGMCCLSQTAELTAQTGGVVEPSVAPAPDPQTSHAARVLATFGVATHLAFALAAEYGAERVLAVAKAARRTKDAVSAGWLVSALRDGWEFATVAFVPNARKGGRGEQPGTAPVPKPPASDAAPNAPAPVVAPVPDTAPDPLDALAPDEYNALSGRAEAEIKAAYPLYGRVGAPKVPRPAVRDRMRKLLADGGAGQ